MAKLTQQEVIQKIINVHGYTYDTSKLIYVNNATKFTLICKKHQHEFSILLGSITKGHGCPICGKEKISINKRLSYLEYSKRMVNSKYLLLTTKDEFNTAKTTDKLNYFCTIHNQEFTARRHEILKGNNCCVECHKENLRSKKALTTEEFISKAKLLNFTNISYTKVSYVNTKTNVTLTCSEHGDFQKRPEDHLNGQGCPDCSSYGFNPKSSAILYFLEINNGQCYKLGITNKTINDRFKPNELKSINLLAYWDFELGLDAYTTEQSLLTKYQHLKYSGPSPLVNGNTELLTTNILPELLKELPNVHD